MFYERFICAAEMQENKQCNDFEARFCCHKNFTAQVITNTERPIVKSSTCVTADLENLNINDIRKLNRRSNLFIA